jgi:hypothetical protein
MSPLYIEVFHPIDNKWLKVGQINPKDRPGSLSHNSENGKREMYVFSCMDDDLKSVICKSGFGMDSESGITRTVIDYSKPKIIKELKKGESFEMKIKNDKSPEAMTLRFSHK